MVRYQKPPKSWEIQFCRSYSELTECRATTRGAFDPLIDNVSFNNFEVKTSSLGVHVGRGIFTKVDIPMHNFVMLETAVHNVQFPPFTHELIENTLDVYEEMAEELQVVADYMEGYGYENDVMVGG